MQKLDEYITVGTKRMRCGYTTGTCAAAAARAAAELLVSGTLAPAVSLETPAGITVAIDVEEHCTGDGWAECAVRKDAGDDPDVTDGALVVTQVAYSTQPGVRIDGGTGVGRVTQPGLDQPVGAAAINSTPRRMIAEQVLLAAHAAGIPDEEVGFDVLVSVPDGEELASHTFNPKLGIEGGISVLGTSGIVRPMSEDALVASIELELKVLHERGVRDVLVVPGNYGRDFALGELDLDLGNAVQCSNYLGATLDAIQTLGFDTVLLVGHLGKMAKVAGGIMNTHSRVADCRCEIVTAHAALAGAPREAIAQIMDAATTDAALDILDAAGLRAPVMKTLIERLHGHLCHRVGDRTRIEAVVFSNKHGILGTTAGAPNLLALHESNVEQGS